MANRIWSEEAGYGGEKTFYYRLGIPRIHPRAASRKHILFHAMFMGLSNTFPVGRYYCTRVKAVYNRWIKRMNSDIRTV